VEQKIGGLGAEFLNVIVLSLDHEFDSLFADLLGDPVNAAGEEF
jgi:hypothetical protein